jgi:platelet-activating factor acetylhydrolase IB subunit alpha
MCCSSLNGLTLTFLVSQTARVWDAKSGETKAELRGHDHFILVGVFAPVSAYAAIKELTV